MPNLIDRERKRAKNESNTDANNRIYLNCNISSFCVIYLKYLFSSEIKPLCGSIFAQQDIGGTAATKTTTSNKSHKPTRKKLECKCNAMELVASSQKAQCVLNHYHTTYISFRRAYSLEFLLYAVFFFFSLRSTHSCCWLVLLLLLFFVRICTNTYSFTYFVLRLPLLPLLLFAMESFWLVEAIGCLYALHNLSKFHR